MKCLIIEDELAGQEILKIKLAKHFPTITIEKIINSQNEAINYLNENDEKIDFIFLDIEIKGGSGLQVLKSITNRTFDVIITTAYEEYAIESFKLNAVHYLLKPINDQDFIEAVNRITSKNNSTEPYDTDFIFIPNKNEITKIEITKIIFCKSDGAYTEIYLDDKKIISSKSIGEIEKILNSNLFYRVHHSYIVNLNKIETIEKGRSGNIILHGNHSIPISQRKMNDFMTKI